MKIFEYDGYPAVYLKDVMEELPIQFKECEVHPMIRYAGDKCPVCAAIEERDLALGQADEDKTQLQGRIEDLEQQIDAYRQELRL